MISFTDASGLLGSALALSATCLLLPRTRRLPRQYLAGLLAAVFIVSLIPPGGLPLAAYLRGATGDLSITTQLLLVTFILRVLLDWEPLPGRSPLLLLITSTAIIFYPLALGLGSFDPYRLGYGSIAMLAALLLLTLVAAWRKTFYIALTIPLAVLAWSLGYLESTNLWDYLFDPLLAFYAAGVSIKPGWLRMKGILGTQK